MPEKIKHIKKFTNTELDIDSEDEALHCDTDPEDVDYDSTSSDEGDKTVTSRADQRERRRRESDCRARTVFVGNLPATFTKKKLFKLFKNALRAHLDVVKAGCSVESVRLRGAIPITGGTSNQARKRSSIQHDFAAGNDHTQIGFVVLSSTAGIPAALQMNGHCLSEGDTALPGRHIRVNLCAPKRSSTSTSSTAYNTQKSVFIGNLAFSTNEEQIRDAFSKFGTITNVRLIRDSMTGAVKGIGFVEFESTDSVSLAIRASDSVEVGQRKIRIQPWKSIKKPKYSRSGFPQKHPQQQVSYPGNSIVVPSNLRGGERRKFVKRAFGRRQKRQAAEAAKPTSKTIKKPPKKKLFGKALKPKKMRMKRNAT